MKKEKSYQIIKSNIGNLAIFWSTVGDRVNIEKELGSDFEKGNSETYIKTLIKYICHKEETLIDKDKPKEITLTELEINSLSSDDIETIAKTYINSNEYLFRELISDSKKTKEGHNLISSKFGDIEFPKNEDETYVDYLFRLEIEQNKKIKIAFENSFGNISSFSKSIQDSIRATASLGESFKNAVNAIRVPKLSKIEPLFPKYSKLDISSISKRISDIEQQPMEVVSTGLDELIEINAKSLEFLTETNRTQTLIANEIKTSSIASSKLTKWNIAISIVVLLISLSALVISFQSNKQNNINNSNHIKTIINSLDRINKNLEDISNNRGLKKNEIIYLTSQIDSLKKENQILIDELNNTKLQIKLINQKIKNAP
jgi:hypothetical protein